jgi:hypothetical protein
VAGSQAGCPAGAESRMQGGAGTSPGQTEGLTVCARLPVGERAEGNGGLDISSATSSASAVTCEPECVRDRRRVNRYGTWPACVARSSVSTYGEGIELSGSASELLSGCNGPSDVNQSVWRNRATVGQELARVVEEDDAVAQQAPPLLGVEGDHVGRVTVRTVSWGTGGLVLTHFSPLGIATNLDWGAKSQVQLAAATTGIGW